MPPEPPITFGDMRLTRTIQDRGDKYASIEEYSRATGMSIQELLNHVQEHLGGGHLAWETVGGQAFLRTGPGNGPSRRVKANLWEKLRTRHDLDTSYRLWRLGRDLEESGWQVNYDPAAIGGWHPMLSLPLRDGEAPLLLFPTPELLLRESGPLGRLQRAKQKTCAVACQNRHLDSTVTSVRTWMLSREEPSGMAVLILEEPLYQPLKIDSQDGSLTPRSTSITREAPGLAWKPPA